MEKINKKHGQLKTLEFQGDTSIKYAEVVSIGDSMIIVVRILGGH